MGPAADVASCFIRGSALPSVGNESTQFSVSIFRVARRVLRDACESCDFPRMAGPFHGCKFLFLRDLSLGFGRRGHRFFVAHNSICEGIELTVLAELKPRRVAQSILYCTRDFELKISAN